MSGLKGMFDDEFRDLSASLRDAPEFDELAAVRSVRRRRTTRTMTVAAGGVLAMAAVGVGALAWGGGSDGGPATSVSPSPTPSVSASPSASASASPTDDGVVTSADATDGWFLLSVQVDQDAPYFEVDLGGGIEPVGSRATDALLMVSPDGELTEIGTLDQYDASRLVGWTGEQMWLDQDNGQYFYAVLEDTEQNRLLTVDLESGQVISQAHPSYDESYAIGGPQWVGGVSASEFVVGLPTSESWGIARASMGSVSSVLCHSFALLAAMSVSPSGDSVVCFNVDAGRSSVEMAATDGSYVREVADLQSNWPTVVVVGWVDETTVLFAESGDEGFGYFALDLETGSIEVVAVPWAASYAVATYDNESETYVRSEGGITEFYGAEGTLLTSFDCSAGDYAVVPAVVYSGSKAIVKCAGAVSEGIDHPRESVVLVDLETGAVQLLDLVGYPAPAHNAWIDVIPFDVPER
ncbi:hypothetical protein [Demequina zhanjiangensis]|uniref:Uncharacterized protein n=1 Tax=Demequina zhanjiangensis TaxID=3051659 RepID=A0ABT8FZ98_9MICO|nr:hypothetical protein [Demequina sp. SYSU T00b26]MDN4472137.1 hypothetical protein [Demequina sp. SYSU T00b26]